MGKLIKTSVFAAIGCAVLLVAGCLPNGLSVNAARPQPVFDGNAWVTYWDFEQGLKEAVKVQSQLNSVSYFAAVFDGLEIDYENLWKDPVVARNFMHFLEILVPMAEKEKIPLRIVLEPGFSEFETPIDLAEGKFEFPEGPEYVVMCYNLFGTHSKLAGPKADIKFLDRMLVKTSQLPRPHSVALAVGGCVWQEGKAPYYVTEKEAVSENTKAESSLDPGNEEKPGREKL